MKALDGPMKGKEYTVPDGVLRVIDHWYDDLIYLHKVTYMRTDEGWVLETHESDEPIPTRSELQQAIERVRELHKLRIEVNQNGFSNDTCNGCYDEDSSTGEQFHHDYPCPTIKALDGEQ
jgi:hypothetical protein